MTNLLVLGPVTIDKNIHGKIEQTSIGGAVYYQAFVFDKLGINYKILTTLSFNDKDLLNEFPDKSSIIPIYKDQTLYFTNDYLNDENRLQKSNFINNTITVNDLIENNINLDDYDGVLINPLIYTDVNINLLEYFSKNNIPIFLSIQGLLRKEDVNGYVEFNIPSNLNEILKYANLLFLDEFEANYIYPDLDLFRTIKKITNLGPNEVIITENNKGSLLYSKFEKKLYDIEAFKPYKVNSPTGAGDTYMAAYIAKRLNKGSIYESGKFATVLTTVKIENKGPFNKSILYVLSRLLDFCGF
ncbi:hypothetical protein BGI41_05490 [Methanobrevibacter sp. 87.7]|uniref:PfkB family carbohydrate kinase n=1 Tax=Methanobrevibacter sp. 87.7 TaxID=387957 RepID=UPI000B501A95|nr:PfkB family carbohydrate kinase [Methanobrevibacter sp. 87.7]OWT32841.1 hypothetical protein BGI41_05490 [Methanobrevibacter sp. 87.7]